MTLDEALARIAALEREVARLTGELAASEHHVTMLRNKVARLTKHLAEAACETDESWKALSFNWDMMPDEMRRGARDVVRDALDKLSRDLRPYHPIYGLGAAHDRHDTHVYGCPQDGEPKTGPCPDCEHARSRFP